ncbi:hypothetical protein PFISCL1PPCAC_5462, partial [Pristionchus fissidentatus]
AAQNGINQNISDKGPSSWRRQHMQTGNVRSKTQSFARSIVASIEEEHDSLYASMDEEDSIPETPKKNIAVPRLRVSVGPVPNRVPVVPPSVIDYSSFPSSQQFTSREHTAVQYGSRQGEHRSNPPAPPPRPVEEKVENVRRQRSSSQPPELTRQRLREFTFHQDVRLPPSDTASISSRAGSSSFLPSGVRSDRTTSIRSQWEAACVSDEKEARAEALRVSRSRGYSFPKWRSNDALSASLVASNEKGSVQIPVDSRIPEDRQRRMFQTEIEARETKVLIHREAQLSRKPSLHRGRSVDAMHMQLDHSPWYDEREIRGGIERESIANMQRTRARFETPINSTVNSRLTSPLPPPPSLQQLQHPQPAAVIDERSTSSPPSEHRLTPPNQPMIRMAPSSNLGSSFSLSSRLSPEEARLVQYLRQNSRVAISLGISIPPDLMRDVITSHTHYEPQPVQSSKYEEFPSCNGGYRRTEIMAREEQ